GAGAEDRALPHEPWARGGTNAPRALGRRPPPGGARLPPAALARDGNLVELRARLYLSLARRRHLQPVRVRARDRRGRRLLGAAARDVRAAARGARVRRDRLAVSDRRRDLPVVAAARRARLRLADRV